MSEAVALADVLQSAYELKAQLTELKGKIGKNRQLANLLVSNGVGTPEEAAKVAELYPPHKTKPAPSAPTPGDAPESEARAPESPGDAGPATEASEPLPAKPASKPSLPPSPKAAARAA